MADVRGAWNETGDKLSELGRKLKIHYDAQHGTEGEKTRAELTDAARKIGAAVQDAFEALGTAARDKAVHDDVKQVSQSLVEALGATVGQAAGELRKAFSERKGPAGTDPRTAVPDPVVTDATVGEPPAPTTEASPGVASTPNDGEQPPKVEPWGTP